MLRALGCRGAVALDRRPRRARLAADARGLRRAAPARSAARSCSRQPRGSLLRRPVTARHPCSRARCRSPEISTVRAARRPRERCARGHVAVTANCACSALQAGVPTPGPAATTSARATATSAPTPRAPAAQHCRSGDLLTIRRPSAAVASGLMASQCVRSSRIASYRACPRALQIGHAVRSRQHVCCAATAAAAPVARPRRTAKLAACVTAPEGRRAVQPTDTTNPDYFHRVVDCQWACPAHTDVPEYIRLIALGPVLRRLHGQPGIERVPRHPRPRLRPSLRARLPPRPRRGQAGRDLPPEARRGRPQGRHRGPPAGDPGAEERQARRLHRRRPGLAHRRERPAAARLRGRDLRAVGQAGRPDAHQHPGVPPARDGDRRGDRLHHRHGRRDPLQLARRQHEEAARHRRLRRRVRRLGRAEGQGAQAARPRRKATPTSTSASSGSSRSRSSTSTRSASAC